MENICQILQGAMLSKNATSTNFETKPEIQEDDWSNWLPGVKEAMRNRNIDDAAKNFDFIVAKVCAMQNRKGLLMFGGVGSGKTKRLRFLAETSPAQIPVVSASDICSWWVDCGQRTDVMRDWYKCDRHAYNRSDPRARACDICVDDLGTEPAKCFAFGNNCDVMRDVFLPMRYDIRDCGKTYITTNLTDKQLLERYGERVYSRLHEMCFFLPVIHGDRRLENNEF